MGLIQDQDQRPRDWTYAARFKEKDLPSLEEMARHIRETHDTDMIEDFNRKCEQKLSGESAILENGIEIEAVTKTGDLVVNGGLQQCINIILGTSSARWSYFGMSGGSGSTPAVTDTALGAETIAERVTFAWAEPVGMRIFFGGISSQTEPSAPIGVYETGIYNGSAAGAILLNRSYFNPIGPTQDVAGGLGDIKTAPIVLSTVIEFCPMA